MAETTQPTYDAIVVGAGISGLSTAYELHRRGARVLVLEASNTPGGAMQSQRFDSGFQVENGPNTVVSRSAELEQHLSDLGILAQRVVADRAGARRFILHNGVPTLIPTSPGALVNSPLLSTAGKARMLAEPLIPKASTPDESVAAFFQRRLGSEVFEHLVDPFVSGVYAGDPRELSMRATFPSLWQAEQRGGSLIPGMLSAPRKPRPAAPPVANGDAHGNGGKRPRSVMMNFTGGLSLWAQAMADQMGEQAVWYNSPVTGVAVNAPGWAVTVQRDGVPQTLHTQLVVSAVPTGVLADLLEPLDVATADILRPIFYPPLAMVHLGFHKQDVEHPLDGFGMLCPAREQRQILGVLFPSSLFPGRAPEGMHLTTTFVGGARAPHLAHHDDEALIELVLGELRATLGVRGAPTFQHVVHWRQAIPQYRAGYQQVLDALQRCEALFAGLHIIGNFRDGVSVEQCWRKGHTLGQELPLHR